MKKCVFLFLIFISVLLLNINGYAQSISYDEQDSNELADIPPEGGGSYYIRPHTSGDNTYVIMLPLTDVLYEYADIDWDSERSQVNITCGTLDVSMRIGETGYVINGEQSELDAPPEIIGGKTYVPATFFEKTFGFMATDSGEGIIDLFMPGYIIENI